VRADLVLRRLAAHRKRDDLTGLPISIVGKIVNLMNRGCVEVLVATIREASHLLGREVGFIVIDTLAKGIAAGGGDENQAKDMGAALAHLRMVQEITGVHIAIIHHTGKDESKGARGSNSQLGDVDLMIQISGEGAIKVATVTAANDQAEGELTRFRGEVVTLRQDEDGDNVTAMILSTDTCQSGEEVEAKTQLSANDRRALTMLVTAINEAGQPAPTSAHFPPFARVVPIATWREYHRRGSVDDTPDATRKAFKRASDNLVNTRRIGIFDGYVWVVDG
jgi:hypothetical protein